MRRKRLLLMLKVFHRSLDAEKMRTKLYAEANGVMKKMPYVERTLDDGQDEALR